MYTVIDIYLISSSQGAQLQICTDLVQIGGKGGIWHEDDSGMLSLRVQCPIHAVTLCQKAC